MSADRHLLYGLLALQCGFISKEQLVAAMSAWTSDKRKSLEAILEDQKALTPHQRELLHQLEQEMLQHHSHNVEQSLAVISTIGSLRQDLEALADPELNATLMHVAKGPKPEDTSAFFVAGAGQETRREGALRYRTIRLHAKGGLGEVYVAKDEELHREVALKEIQDRFADNDESRARFRLEAEITGNLEHPGIVPVYGLGQYQDGRPYYAMRFIRGDSLKEAIEHFHQQFKSGSRDRTANLELRKLLRRFVDVCNAMEYAHSRGVLHRDLKPGNIILGKYGETLVVDWGLAKAQGKEEIAAESMGPVVPSGSGATPTLMGSALGTPAYMSPEQAAGKLDELGPATDVYSLGATLFQLLTGKPPIAGKSPHEVVEKAAAGQIRRPRELRADVPKALEAVCLKAMSKSPAERYASPVTLAEEVEKWLADEPVRAYAEPFLTRAKRWMRRHPAIVSTSAACALLGLGAALLVAYLQNAHAREVEGKNATISNQVAELTTRNATIEKQKGELQKSNADLLVAKNEAQAAEKEATLRKDMAESVTQFLVQSFKRADPDQDGKKLTIYDALVRGRTELDQSERMDPHNKARILNAMFAAFEGLGMPKEALESAKSAHQIFVDRFGATHEFTLASRDNLARAYRSAGELKVALPLFESGLRDAEEAKGPNEPGIMISRNNLGMLYLDLGKIDLALPLLEKNLAARKAVLGENHADTLTSKSNLAGIFQAQGKMEEAISLFEEVLKSQRESLGPTHTWTLTSEDNLAMAYLRVGKRDLALPLEESCYKGRREKLGDDHPDTLNAQANLASIYQEMGKTELALPMFEKTLAARRARMGEVHPSVLASKNNLAEAYRVVKRFDEAIVLFKDVLEQSLTDLGDDHPRTLATKNNLALAYKDAGKPEEAVPLLESALGLMRAKAGENHPQTLVMQGNYADALLAAKQGEKGEAELLDLLKRRQAAAKGAAEKWMPTALTLASRLNKYERFAGVEAILREVLAIRQAQTPDVWSTFALQTQLGAALVPQKKYAEAETLLLGGFKGMEDRKATIPAQGLINLQLAAQKLIDLYTATDKPVEAATWKAKLEELQKEKNAISK